MTDTRFAPIDASEDAPVNPRAASAETIGQVISRRLSRRGFLAGLGAASGLAITGCATPAAPEALAEAAPASQPRFRFSEIPRGSSETHLVADGHRADVLIRWGDGLFADSPDFTPGALTAEAQRRQFGYNNDFIGYIRLDPQMDGAERGLLCVNHEYTNTELMFPGIDRRRPEGITREICEVEMAANGGSVVEIRKAGGRWDVVKGSPYNRRLTAETPMRVTGPAAGHPRLRTREDAEGLTVEGTFNNCAGGITPWGTYLMAEENVNGYFLGALPEGHAETENHKRMGVPGGWYQWGQYFERFDIGQTPNEPNRFGWIVEVDVHDPGSMPKKRTALGRFKHEGAETVVAPDGRVVVYMGDDQRFDYVYKFVTKNRFVPGDDVANRDLLDEGTLYVARFDADGTVAWLALVQGEGPLTPENGFRDQGDVVIEARRAGDLLGATPMDRPEDVEPNPQTGRVYVMLTNNTDRTGEQADAANPRGPNAGGHIIEIIEPGGDFTATRSRWEVLVLCGDPASAEAGAMWNPETSANGWFTAPDNCAIDPQGRLWVSTDGNERSGALDGIWAMETEGPLRGKATHFFRVPIGAEMCGPRFNPSGDSFFLAVQHPAEGSTYDAPSTRWPDFDPALPPRPSVVVVMREDGGPVG